MQSAAEPLPFSGVSPPKSELPASLRHRMVCVRTCALFLLQWLKRFPHTATVILDVGTARVPPEFFQWLKALIVAENIPRKAHFAAAVQEATACAPPDHGFETGAVFGARRTDLSHDVAVVS